MVQMIVLICLPSIQALRLSKTISALRLMDSLVAKATWGVRRVLGAERSGVSRAKGGSLSNTSTRAPAISPFYRASTRAFTSTTGPRATFTSIALFFIFPSSLLPIRPLVSGVRGQWSTTMSEDSKSSSSPTSLT